MTAPRASMRGTRRQLAPAQGTRAAVPALAMPALAMLALAMLCSTPAALAVEPPVPATTADTTAGSTTRPAPRTPPAWIAESNANARILLAATGPADPERMTLLGVPGFDAAITDLAPAAPERQRAAIAAAREQLEQRLAASSDPDVRQDLDLLIGAANRAIEGSQLRQDLLLPWTDAPQVIFLGMQGVLSEQTPPTRRALALARLQRYAGTCAGCTPFTQLAMQQFERALPRRGARLPPSRREVEQALSRVAAYRKALPELVTRFHVADAAPALAALDAELAAWADWTRRVVLPLSRADSRLPPALYAFKLREAGIDIAPRQLIERAELEYMETREAMQQLAPLIAREHGWTDTDYRAVIRALKREQLPREQLEPVYREVLAKLEAAIAEHDIVTLPAQPMRMRLASAGESAAQPAPQYLPAPLLGGGDTTGVFLLPVANPAAGAQAAYDDFNFPAAAWTLTAHEGRPGHDLQFRSIVERGLSLARTLFAFNSVNTEGWALYAEAEMVPHEPLDGQMIALQMRLLRAARAMLDPMLNLGLTDRERARRLLEDEVVLSPAMTRQELDRYTFNMPGQAGSYFYGYARLLQLRAATELALGAEFDPRAFNDFILDQGLQSPDAVAEAVRTRFVPAMRAKAGGRAAAAERAANQ